MLIINNVMEYLGVDTMLMDEESEQKVCIILMY